MGERKGFAEDWEFKIQYRNVSKVIRVMQRNFHDPPRHHTRRYYESIKIIHNNSILQQPIEDVLMWFFYQDRDISMNEKLAVEMISYCPQSRIIEIKTNAGDQIYEGRDLIARKTGWYFYVTGVDLPTSDLSSRVDEINRQYNLTCLKWELAEATAADLVSVACGPNANSYLLSFCGGSILLDAGLGKNGLKVIRDEIDTKLDAVFISHAHFDHTSGLIDIVEAFPRTPILLSRTTLDFFLLQNGCLNRDFTSTEIKLIENSLPVKNCETLPFAEPRSHIEFFFAGHMPGALMFLMELGGFRFLYTGDYYFYDSSPIPGIHRIAQFIPSPIDFLLVDGTFSRERFSAPRYQYRFLMNNLITKAIYNNSVLIGADPASLAINLFTTIHNEFIRLKEERYFERPFIYLNRKVYEFARVLCSRSQDLDPITAQRIQRDLNPFQSALIRWVNTTKDKRKAESELLAPNRSRGAIVIFDPADLTSDWMLDFLQIIGSHPHNAIYLAGALRNPTAIELVSGTDRLTLQYSSGSQRFLNRAHILNRIKPNNIVNLHADEFQLRKLISRTQPVRICFFQQDPRKLVAVRNWVLKDFPCVKETLALYGDSTEKIQLK